MMVWNPRKHDGQGGFDKPPVNPHTLRDGSSTDPERWGTFDEAADQIGRTATVFKNGIHVSGEVFGVGIVLAAAGLVGVDMDSVLTKQSGRLEVSPEAKKIWQYFDSYTELSPSKTGIHILMRGRKPPGGVCKIKRPFRISDGSTVMTEYEMYDSGRYFTVTGNFLNGCTRGAEERQAQIEKVYQWFEQIREEMRPGCGAPLGGTGGSGSRYEVAGDDRELWEKMFSSRRGEEIRRLYDGDLSPRGGDHSSCDLALCNHLAYWTNLNVERIDRMFRQSGLMREKWNRTDYRTRTIGTAVAGKTAYRGYTPEEKREYARRKQDEETGTGWDRIRRAADEGREAGTASPVA